MRPEQIEEQHALLGRSGWENGIEANARIIAEFCEAAHNQGIIERPVVHVEDLFRATHG